VLDAWDLDGTTSRRSVREPEMEERMASCWGAPPGAPGDAASRAPAPLIELSQRVMNPMVVAATFVACAMTLVVVQMVWTRNNQPSLPTAGIRSASSAVQTATEPPTRSATELRPRVASPPAMRDGPCLDPLVPVRTQPWTEAEIEQARRVRNEVIQLQNDCPKVGALFPDPGSPEKVAYCEAWNADRRDSKDALERTRRAAAEGGRFRPYAMLLVGSALLRWGKLHSAKCRYLDAYRSSPDGEVTSGAKVGVRDCNQKLGLPDEDGLPRVELEPLDQRVSGARSPTARE
jgi:hypothetical protein